MFSKSMIDLYDNLGIQVAKSEFYEDRRIDILQKEGNVISFKHLNIDIKNEYIFNLSKDINSLENNEIFTFSISRERYYLYNKINITAKKINDENFIVNLVEKNPIETILLLFQKRK